VSLALIGLGLAGALAPADLRGQELAGPVYVALVHGEIDLGLAPYIKRVLRQAGEDAAAAVVLDINTPGGRLDAALQIKDAVLDSEVPVIAFVNREAFSAGALIAIAADRIYISPAGVMGAATPISGDTGEKASEKVVSAIRKAFGAVAEHRGRDPRVAEAMVDEDVAVEGLVEAGKLLTLTAKEAVTWGYAEGMAEDLAAVLEAEGLGSATLVETAPSWSEGLVRVLTNPAIASMLISLGFLGLFFEITSPGFGLPGLIGLGLLAVFFWGHMLAGLTGWEGVALVVIGIALMALEAFVVPGFGVAGVLGVTAFLAGLFVSLIGQDPAVADLQRAALTVLGSLAAMVAGASALIYFLPRGGVFSGMVLQERLDGMRWPARPPRQDLRDAETGAPPGRGPSMVGALGVAITDLRPAGGVRIDGERVDVVTEGDYLEAGTGVEVVLDDGYRRVVRAASATPTGGPAAVGGTDVEWGSSGPERE
jgi:membrane-bound serine protease (ClpP class)